MASHVLVKFEKSELNYKTSVSGSVSVPEILRYFVGQQFNFSEKLETCVNCLFLYEVIDGAFKGERGYLDMRSNADGLLYLEKFNGNKIAVVYSQIKKVV